MYLTTRTRLGAFAVMALAACLAWRIAVISREPRIWVSPRVAQLMYNRMLAERIREYARTYGRPAYYIDSVQAHLDSSEARHLARLRSDLWGRPVFYWWDFCSFTIGSNAGAPLPAANDTTERPDSIPPGVWWTPPRGDLREDFAWPPGVGRSDRCLGHS